MGERNWDKAKAKFEHSLTNVDEKIVLNIKFAIQNNLDNPRQIIHLFSKYENILKRQKIREMLKIECDHLHESIISFMKSLSESLNENNATKEKQTDDEYEVSLVVSQIELLKIIEYQVNRWIYKFNGILY